MLQKVNSRNLMLFFALAVFVTACTKDPFSEKDALAAQQNLLQLQFSYQLQIAQVNASASRSHDSALIAIQNLQNSGASALAILNAQNQMAYLMQQYQNQLAMYKMQDSLARATSKFNDSLTAARNDINRLNALKKNYSVAVIDNSTNAPVAGATVSVFSYTANAILTATTDGSGVALFNQVIVDPSAYFYISNTGYATVSTLVGYSTSYRISLWNNANAQNTVKGQIVADLDLTNGATVEGVAGQLVTFTVNYNSQNIQFAAVTDANGNYSIKLPNGPNGNSYVVNTASTITVSQKMFVRYFQGIDDPFKTLPHIDSVNTTLQVGYSNNYYNYVKPTYTPTYGVPYSSGAFYLAMPNDSLGNKIFIPLLRSFINNINCLATTEQNNPTNTAPPTIQNDSIYAIFYTSWFGSQYNMVGGINNSGYASYYNISYDDYTYNYSKKDTIINATLVDLTGKIMTASPTILVHINAQGKIQNIVSARGGLLQGSGMYDYNLRDIATNVFGYRDANFRNNCNWSTAYITVQGGTTQTVNFDYAYLVSRDKNPQ